MSAIANFTACICGGTAVNFDDRILTPGLNWRAITRISMPHQSSAFQLTIGHSSRATKNGSIRMALVDEKLAPGSNVAQRSGFLAYDLVQGALVQWSSAMDKSMPDPPTAVLLHGILGSRKNWGTFTRRLAQEFPMWQFLLVDLRCHGDSAALKKRGPHTVASTAFDVLKLEGGSQARYFVSRLIPAHRDPPYVQEARFPKLRSSTPEQKTKLECSFFKYSLTK